MANLQELFRTVPKRVYKRLKIDASFLLKNIKLIELYYENHDIEFFIDDLIDHKIFDFVSDKSDNYDFLEGNSYKEQVSNGFLNFLAKKSILGKWQKYYYNPNLISEKEMQHKFPTEALQVKDLVSRIENEIELSKGFLTKSQIKDKFSSHLLKKALELIDNVTYGETYYFIDKLLIKDHISKLKEEKQKKKAILRNKVTDLFSDRWESRVDIDTQVTIHVGPTNSGKTYTAIEAIKESSGLSAILLPLRLLVWEVADKLNSEGYPCSLVTGEEIQKIDDAKITSATVEMFDYKEKFYENVIIDECHMLTDKQRGWAWTRAIIFAKTKNLHLITAPHAKDLLIKLVNKLGYKYEIKEYKRLSNLVLSNKSMAVSKSKPQTIFIVFDRLSVLNLKTFLESKKKKVSVIYGALPPEVRRKQAERFLNRETDICVATDAVGMGLNLPAKTVCFVQLQKFDGEKIRDLTSEEVLQIAGRAGRYKEDGMVTTANDKDLPKLKALFSYPVRIQKKCYIAPEREDLLEIEGSVLNKLNTWELLNAVPSYLKDIFELSDLSSQKELANMLSLKIERILGFDKSFLLVKTPINKYTHLYWYKCVEAIAENKELPLIRFRDSKPSNQSELDRMETAVKECEIYMWLANHKEFYDNGKEYEYVLDCKRRLSSMIDEALLDRIVINKKCSICGNDLPLFYRYGICNDCYYSGDDY